MTLTIDLAPASVAGTKHRIAVVSSYHPEYLWSQDTNRGVTSALLEFGYLDKESQAIEYSKTNYVESSRAKVKKWWMDTKRKNRVSEIRNSLRVILAELKAFKPDIILLGDDNATNYIGNQYIDTEIPVVFWGVNGNPLKYGLVETTSRPGHNITGVYQAGYFREAAILIQKLIPGVHTMAVLSDDSPTGRGKAKKVMQLSRQGKLPVKIIEVVMTNSLEIWKRKALALQTKADAFFVLNHNTLRDAKGRPIDQLEIGAWYLRNIRKPEISIEKQFAEEGMLSVVDDSGFKQGYEATIIAHRILHNGEDPAKIAVYAPKRGNFIVNRERARMLGILDRIQSNKLIDEWIESAAALKRKP